MSDLGQHSRNPAKDLYSVQAKSETKSISDREPAGVVPATSQVRSPNPMRVRDSVILHKRKGEPVIKGFASKDSIVISKKKPYKKPSRNSNHYSENSIGQGMVNTCPDYEDNELVQNM